MKEKFRVIIAGSRGFDDYNLLVGKCNYLLSEKMKTHDIVIISGTARGADQLGEKFAEEMGYELEKYPADWDKYGKSAGYIRNKEMAEHADAVICFWDGSSLGTKHMVDIAKEKGLIVKVIRY